MRTSGRFRMFLAVASLLVFNSCAVPIRVEDAEGKAVSKVSIRYVGPKTIDEDRLRTHIRTTAGSRYVSERVDEDIKALYESGIVNDVRVLAGPKRNGVEVIFEVQTRGVSHAPIFVGNTKVSDQRLWRETGLKFGEPIDRPSIETAARKVEAWYHSHGYPDTKATVRYREWGTDDPWDFQILIEEAPGTE